MTAHYGHISSDSEQHRRDSVYDLRCQLRIDDVSALWDAASAKAMTYPDATAETVVETIGPREDPEITECLLLLLQPTIAGCDLVALGCAAATAAGAIPAPNADIKQRTPNSAIGTTRPPSFLRTWKTRGAAEFSRAVRAAD